ncbi:formylglycine-generating enzyme family protein [Flavobacterium sp. U410]|jgi:formylglycine-generating enzyme required for sulfatase activity
MKIILTAICSLLLFTITSFSQSTPDMILVEGGEFRMGTKKNSSIEGDEQLDHDVELNSFYIGKYEVTLAEWKIYTLANKIKMPNFKNWNPLNLHPITNISWTDAVNYCNWLSERHKLKPVYKRTGTIWVRDLKANGYRLPTEAEWEYAAKGGKSSKGYKFSGSDVLDRVAWYNKNSKSPNTIGTKLPNELGLYDMSGNAWEWCWDWYNRDFYLTETKYNPTGPEHGTERCLRGGSWDSRTYSLRVANRWAAKPFMQNDFFGFRLARNVD